jgi:uncharacterized membrane protein YkvA (DUF1232 family)
MTLEHYPEKQANWFQTQLLKGRKGFAFAISQAWTFTLVIKHPRSPWLARVVAAGTVAYLLSPIQLIPTFIPVIGQLDDLFVLYIGMKLLRKLTPEDVLADCGAQARSSFLVQRIEENRWRQPEFGPEDTDPTRFNGTDNSGPTRKSK